MYSACLCRIYIIYIYDILYSYVLRKKERVREREKMKKKEWLRGEDSKSRDVNGLERAY